MATPTLFVNVWTDAKEVALGPVEQQMSAAIGATSVTVGSIARGTSLPRKRVRFLANVDCYVAWGLSPVASATSVPLVGNSPEYFDIPSGEAIAVIERV